MRFFWKMRKNDGGEKRQPETGGYMMYCWIRFLAFPSTDVSLLLAGSGADSARFFRLRLSPFCLKYEDIWIVFAPSRMCRTRKFRPERLASYNFHKKQKIITFLFLMYHNRSIKEPNCCNFSSSKFDVFVNVESIISAQKYKYIIQLNLIFQKLSNCAEEPFAWLNFMQ